jgi:hypothetical protein
MPTNWINKKNAIGTSLLAFSSLLLLLAFYSKSFLALLLGILLASPAAGLFHKKLSSASTVVFSITFALFAGEILLEFLAKNSTIQSSDSIAGYVTKSDLGYQGRPGIHASRKLADNGEPIYTVKYTIGDDGFRTTPHDYSISKAVNFLGCSFTFGEGLDDDQTLPYYVSKLGGYHVRNYGFFGYGPHQALAILTSTRNTDGAINFFLTAPWHAERSACIPIFSAGSPRYYMVDGNIQQNGVCMSDSDSLSAFLRKIAMHSKIYQLIQAGIAGLQNQDEQINLYVALIDKLNRISISRGQRFILGFIKADEKWFRGTYSNESVIEKIRSQGIEVIDMTLAKRTEDLDEKYYIHPLDKHPSALANEERAKILLNVLH